jgi:hypothetical protein
VWIDISTSAIVTKHIMRFAHIMFFSLSRTSMLTASGRSSLIIDCDRKPDCGATLSSSLLLGLPQY